jgi:hypothetical protein
VWELPAAPTSKRSTPRPSLARLEISSHRAEGLRQVGGTPQCGRVGVGRVGVSGRCCSARACGLSKRARGGMRQRYTRAQGYLDRPYSQLRATCGLVGETARVASWPPHFKSAVVVTLSLISVNRG